MDGFRGDYLDHYDAPTLKKLAAEGVRGSIIPCFPAKTFPNHYAMVTGLYPAENGIVANSMWDPEIPGTFKMTDEAQVTDSRWWKGEPIWVTAVTQGQKSATEFWPGSEAAITGVRPSYWDKYDQKRTANERVDHVLQWLDLPEPDRPTFVALYFEDTDHAGHDFGPGTKEVGQAIATIDKAVARLVSGLEQRHLLASTDLILLADHGMTRVSRDKTLVLDSYVDPQKLAVLEYSPVFMFNIRSGDPKKVLAALKKMKHLKIYARDQTPLRWHYRNNPRITSYVGLFDEGWSMNTRKKLESDSKYPGAGNHGFDNELPSMRAVFIANGPDFKPGTKLAPVPNIHLYSLMCRLLGLIPAENDGDWKVFSSVLAVQEAKTEASPIH